MPYCPALQLFTVIVAFVYSGQMNDDGKEKVGYISWKKHSQNVFSARLVVERQYVKLHFSRTCQIGHYKPIS